MLFNLRCPEKLMKPESWFFSATIRNEKGERKGLVMVVKEMRNLRKLITVPVGP